MDVEKFSDTLCHLNTAIDKYLKAKKAREIVSVGRYMPNEITNTVTDVLDERISIYEKQIIELATKLTTDPHIHQAKDGDRPKKN